MKIITVSREFGSGGRTIAKAVAESLGIAYYDKALVKQVAVATGFDEGYIERQGEYAPVRSRLAYMLTGGGSDLSMSAEDFLWMMQRKVILELAEKEPCVIVGRCADYILRERTDCLHVFVHADMAQRADRIVRLYGEADTEPEKRLEEKDRRRRLYYKRYTEREWGMSQNYHLSLDSGRVGIDRCCDTIITLYRSL